MEDRGTEPNPYQSPKADVANAAPQDPLLADRLVRLGASLIDGVIMMVVVSPLMYLGGYWQLIFDTARSGGSVPITTTLMWAVVGFGVFVLVQGFPLHATGQTWGKRITSIKIVQLDGSKPALGDLLLKRYLPLHAIGNIPVLGSIYALVDTLMIFRDDRRCLHDLIAGTKVIKAD